MFMLFVCALPPPDSDTADLGTSPEHHPTLEPAASSSAIVRPWVVRAGWGCSSIGRRERVVSWSTGTLSLVTTVMKARHPRCSGFMLSRITTSFAEYSALVSSLRSIFQSVSLRRKKTAKHPIPCSLSLSLSLSLSMCISLTERTRRKILAPECK